MKAKKGALELSMNAIVILILAIALLGLGLTFIRGLFSQATEKVETTIGTQSVIEQPTVDKPLTVTPSAVEVKGGEKEIVTVAYMNTLENEKCVKLSTTFTDKDGDSEADRGALEIESMPFTATCAPLRKDVTNTWSIPIKTALGVDESTTGIITFHAESWDKAGACDCPEGEAVGEVTKDMVLTVNP